MQELVIEYGVWGLFLASFLAATLLPFSSEIALIAAVNLGIDRESALISASVGNVLACLVNYLLGYFFRAKALASLKEGKWGTRALNFWERYGPFTLLLNWAPLIGDPVTIAAGIGRFNFWWFLLAIVTLRVGRYMLILGMIT